MLAACTVGPGTVVTCARSGVEYGSSLAWALCFASVLAYSLQEGSARLTLVSGKTMGQCVQEKFKTSAVGTAPRACWAFTIAVYTGCLLYQCNNFAGGVDALFAFPGMENFSQNAVRIGGCFGYGIAVIAILYQDQADAIGVGLGVVMMAMIVLFLAAAITVGFSWAELAWGLLPTLPQMSAVPDAAAPCEMVLSLVGTTAIGVNLFFSGSMAVGTTMADCRRGIAFSTVSALIVSLLIMIVGSGSAKEADNLGKFNIGLLADAIEHYFGKVGTFAFALGFVAAALSSMLTAVLGIVSAAEGLVLSPKDVEEWGPAKDTAEGLLEHRLQHCPGSDGSDHRQPATSNRHFGGTAVQWHPAPSLQFGPADVHHRPSVHGLAAAQAMLPAVAHRLRDSDSGPGLACDH